MADSSTTLGERVPEITSSRYSHITESTATLSLEVTNYPELEGMGVGEFVSSRLFTVGGYDWKILFYPNGAHEDCTGSASVVVHCASRGKDVSAKFTVSVLEKEGQTPVASCDGGLQVFRLEQAEREWGYDRFVEQSKLESLSCRDDGCFTIRCVLTVRNESPPPELHGHLEGMLRDATGADVMFRVGEREFRAHRSLLAARSPEFRKQFFGEKMEMVMPCVEVVDMDAAIFEMMLHYIYTDSMLPCSDDEGGHSGAVFQKLLVAAGTYGLERLKMMCAEELCKRMEVETVMARFSLAKQHNCKPLKDACLLFMSSSPEVLGVVLENVCQFQGH